MALKNSIKEFAEFLGGCPRIENMKNTPQHRVLKIEKSTTYCG